MHVPDSMLNGYVCPVTAVVSSIGIIAAAAFAAKRPEKTTINRFAAVTALIFAAQMLNFPVIDGTSGHLLGGVLAAAMLGVPWGILSIAVVVSIQALVFGDGGIAVLGANILNMAIIGAGAGGMIYTFLAHRLKGRSGRFEALALAAWLSVVAAALAVSIELAAAGTIPFTRCAPAMLGIHALIGIGEAGITIAAAYAFGNYGEQVEPAGRNTFAAPALTAVLCALVLSPFACGWSDGLEAVGKKLGFLKEAQPLFVSPLPDYLIPQLGDTVISGCLAGLAGVGICLLSAWILGKALTAGRAFINER
ncbi:MAG: energy-coupling factor ABC transporter permease [Victivallaceae bacterium]|nr:energy-coupling factor ABC transporter permease [Victivallaceae bacterium]